MTHPDEGLFITETRRRPPGPVRSPIAPASNDSPKLPAGLVCNTKPPGKPVVGGDFGLLSMDEFRLRVTDGDCLFTLGICSLEEGGLEPSLSAALIEDWGEVCLSSGSGRSRLILDVPWRFGGSIGSLQHATERKKAEQETVNPGQHSSRGQGRAAQHSTAQYSTVQHSTAVQYSTLQQYSTVQHSTAQQYSTVQYCPVLLYSSIVQDRAGQDLYSTVQQYSTVQYNIGLGSTI